MNISTSESPDSSSENGVSNRGCASGMLLGFSEMRSRPELIDGGFGLLAFEELRRYEAKPALKAAKERMWRWKV